MKYKAQISVVIFASLVACGQAPKHTGGTVHGADPKLLPPSSENNAMLTCSASLGRTYKGFGNVELTAGRIDKIPKEGDRFRVKPYGALKTDFQRVLGAVPKSLDANAASFVAAPDRWYVEPMASAVTLFTTYRVSYEAALTLTAADPKYAVAPTQETASAACDTFARQVWNKLPSKEDVAACVKIAVVETAAETDSKARWAYALASVLSSTGFVAY